MESVRPNVIVTGDDEDWELNSTIAAEEARASGLRIKMRELKKIMLIHKRRISD